MDFDEFTGQVNHRLQLPGTGETVRAIRATLMTLGQRIPAGNAKDLAASLPMEIDWYLIEGVDPPEAAYHAQVIVDLVATVTPPSDLRQLRDQLPESEDDENWRKLFAVIDAGGWGEARETRARDGP